MRTSRGRQILPCRILTHADQGFRGRSASATGRSCRVTSDSVWACTTASAPTSHERKPASRSRRSTAGCLICESPTALRRSSFRARSSAPTASCNSSTTAVSHPGRADEHQPRQTNNGSREATTRHPAAAHESDGGANVEGLTTAEGNPTVAKSESFSSLAPRAHGSGSTARTSEPSWFVVTWIFPPTSAARSRMADRPTPGTHESGVDPVSRTLTSRHLS